MKITSSRGVLPVIFLCVLIIGFGYGYSVSRYGLFPSKYLATSIETLQDKEDIHYDFDYLAPIRHKKIGVTVYDRDAVASGVTLLTSYWPDTNWLPGIRIIDVNGKTLHHWITNPAEIWPVSPYHGFLAGTFNDPKNYVQGTYLFENGDILFNIKYMGLVRMDRCGRVMWKLQYRTHHSISPTEDGNFWVAGIRPPLQDSYFPKLIRPFGVATALKVSPNGEILREVDILKALMEAGYHYLFHKYRRNFRNLTHLNDVEELSSELSDKFPQFTAGDIMVSLRQIDTIAVIDVAGNIKWLKSEPFLEPGDPDFEEGGLITLFDSRLDGTDSGDLLGGSVIVGIEPASERIKPIYSSEGFYSDKGKHQLLANGHRLLTEVRAGRVLEINPEGETVWEWVQTPYDDSLVPEVMEGTRYDLSTETVASWACD